MKKLFALLLVITMVFALFACAGKNNNGTSDTTGNTAGNNTGSSDVPDAGDADSGEENTTNNTTAKDTLTVAFTQDRGTLDPLYMVGWDTMNAMRMIYEPLWEFDAQGNQIWLLATSIDILEPTKWHIHLREGVTFENGNPFTAEDALFSMYIANNRLGEPPYMSEYDSENSKVVDEYTLEVVYSEFAIDLVTRYGSLYMYDAESYDFETVSTTPNGTGPYTLDEYVINSHLNLTLRDSYWREMPKIRNLHFRILTEDTQRVNAVQIGAADISSIPFQDVDFVQTLPGVTVDLFPQNMTSTLYMNTSTTRDVFRDNTDARRAVAYAIDRQAILDIAFSGYGILSRLPLAQSANDVEDRFMDLGIYAHPNNGYDPELAKELAISSGLVDKEILLINNGGAANVTACELIQANLKDIGVTVNVQNLDPGSWLTIVFDETQFDMALDFTVGDTMASNYRSWATYHVGGAFTRSPWPGSERFLSLIDGIMAVSDPQELSNMYMELTEIHLNAMIWYTMVDTVAAAAYNSDIVGYKEAQRTLGAVIYSELSWS